MEAVALIVAPDQRIDYGMLVWLRTAASFDDVADLLEARSVAASWHAAAYKNAQIARTPRR